MAAALRRVLVANRGEIAVRIVRACHDEGLRGDRGGQRCRPRVVGGSVADGVVQIGPPSPAASYLRVEQIVAAALLAGCDAVHPGYGFLSERPELAEACARSRACVRRAAGRRDPPRRRQGRRPELPRTLRVCRSARVPAPFARSMPPPRQPTRSATPCCSRRRQGAAGGAWCSWATTDELEERFDAASAEAEAGVRRRALVRRALRRDGPGTSRSSCSPTSTAAIVHLGERDCSLQRRYQKLIEEAPAAVLTPALRERIAAAAVALGRALGYVERWHGRVPCRPRA